MVKVKIIKCSNKSFWYENEIGKIVDDCYLRGGWYITRDEVYSIRKQDAEVVENVEKICKNCKFVSKQAYPNGENAHCCSLGLVSECTTHCYKYWKPIEQADKIAGVGQDAPTIVNEQGGKQSVTMYAFDCLDPKAMFAMCKVLKEGRDKYGTDSNWRRIPVYDHLNHLLIHVFAFMAGDTSDNHLSHALCRAMFALAVDDNE